MNLSDTLRRLGLVAGCGVIGAISFTGANPAFAQDAASATPSPDYIDALRQCQTITDDAARLACFDGAVGSIVTATEEGEVTVVDREDVRETRRSLFGFNVPEGAILGSGEDDEEETELETTIASVRYTGRRQARITTAEGAVWEINNIPQRQRQIRSGDTVVFRKATLGYYFLRINGQRGVKGRRVG